MAVYFMTRYIGSLGQISVIGKTKNQCRRLLVKTIAHELKRICDKSQYHKFLVAILARLKAQPAKTRIYRIKNIPFSMFEGRKSITKHKKRYMLESPVKQTHLVRERIAYKKSETLNPNQ